MSKIKVNSIEAATGSTITIPSGQTLDISSTTLTLPSTVVTTTGSQTLTNKTIGVSQLSGTLPVANGGTGLTTLGSASQVLRVNSGATALEFGTLATGANAGEVINVYTATDETLRSSNSQTFTTASSTLSITMTPTSSSNKVLLMVHTKVQANGTWIAFSFFRDSTNLAGTSNACFASAYNIGGNDGGTENVSFNYLDSPATTSSITYSFRFRSSDNNTSKFNYQPDVVQVATIMALEIKG